METQIDVSAPINLQIFNKEICTCKTLIDTIDYLFVHGHIRKHFTISKKFSPFRLVFNDVMTFQNGGDPFHLEFITISWSVLLAGNNILIVECHARILNKIWSTKMKQYFLQNDRMWKIMVIAISTLRSIVLWNILNFSTLSYNKLSWKIIKSILKIFWIFLKRNLLIFLTNDNFTDSKTQKWNYILIIKENIFNKNSLLS